MACVENWPVDTRQSPHLSFLAALRISLQICFRFFVAVLLRMTSGENVRALARHRVRAVRIPAPFCVRRGRYPHRPVCAVSGLPVVSATAGERPPGASSFRSCGKKRKKGTPKGRAFYKAALPFGILSSEDCFPAASYAPVRVASLCSAHAIAVRRGMSEESPHRELACKYAETTPPVILSAARNLVANLH